MSLKKEVKDFVSDKASIRRSDISVTGAWLRSHPVISACYGFLMITAAGASVMGLLRWNQAFLSWSLAILALCAGAFFFYCSWQGRSR